MVSFRTIKKLLLAIISVVLSLNVIAAALTARVDRDSLSIDETLLLTVATHDQSSQTPDFSSLKSDFDILGNSQSRNIQVVNGHAESTMEWQLTLAPKRIGKLLIPSFNLGKDVSDAITIEVRDTKDQQSASSAPVKVFLETDKESIFSQEQLLVSIKLVTEVNLSQAELQSLEIPNAIVVKLSEQQYQSTNNGKDQLIVETRYAIYPQQSGEIKIPALVYSVVPQVSRNMWDDPFRQRRSSVMRLRTQEKHIEVKPALDASQVPEWHPATEFTVNEGWVGNPLDAKVGEPLTRTITLMADNLTAGQIQPLALPSVDGLTFYPDQPQTKDNKTATGIQGVRTESLAIIPNKPGEIRLPALRIHWFDTKSKQVKVAELPEKVLKVTGAAVVQPSAEQNTTPQVEASNSANPVNASVTTDLHPSKLFYILVLVAALSFVLNVVLFAIILNSRKKPRAPVSEHLEDNELTETKIWDALRAAAQADDVRAMRSAIIQWGQFMWPKSQVNNLDTVSTLSKDSEVADSLRALDEALYGNQDAAAGNVDLHKLLTQLNEMRKRSKDRKEKISELPSFYKE